MSSKSRWIVFLVSTPLVLFAAVGGLFGAGRAPQTSIPHLRILTDVIQHIINDYVEPADPDKVMDGAMRGLVEGLDPMSAYLSPDEVTLADTGAPLPAGSVGLTITRQFYLRVLGVRDGSPAMRAGLRTFDLIRAIDGKPTREISALAGARLLAGDVGSKVSLTVIRGNAAEPHVVDLIRAPVAGPPVVSKRLPSGEGYVRVVSFAAGAAAALGGELDALQKAGAPGAVIDVRGTADGAITEGIAAARLFVKSGTITILSGRNDARTPTTAAAGDGAITLNVVVLTSFGTAGAAEVFAAALSGNHRAEIVGGQTAGLAAVQHLVKLPEGRGLWMTYARYLAPDGTPIHEHGVEPNVSVDEPSVAFDETPPLTDAALAKAIARLAVKKAA
jgi:carboxyl-terminal processing protease